MSNEQAAPDYTAIDYTEFSKTLRFQNKAFINGAFCNALSGEVFDSLNPATGAVLAQVAACGKADVNVAVQHARTAFEDGRWSKLHPSERKAAMLRLAQLMEDNATELSVLESVDSGKPVGECVGVDVPETIKTIRWHAELIDKIYDTTSPAGPNTVSMISREAIGVVGLVLPWNFPLLMLAWKIGPALAAGCSVIVKPAELTTLSTLRVAELVKEAGIPDGVFQVVTGTGKDAGEPIGLHPDVDMVSFTGSTVTGKRFLRYAADSNLKRIVLECGGKNPAVVLADAEDLDAVAGHVVAGAFWNMGENCSATSRLIVHSSIKDKLLAAIGRALDAWKTGDPLDAGNKIGALVSSGHFAKVNAYLEQAKADGCKVVFGGKTTGGAFIEPTVLDGVSSKSRIFREEIFGPILGVTTFETVQEALDLANDTNYGLAASVYTANTRSAMKLARGIKAGTVTVNCFGEGDVSTPFGGFKESGFGGRDKSIFAHDQYTEIKTVWIDVTEAA